MLKLWEFNGDMKNVEKLFKDRRSSPSKDIESNVSKILDDVHKRGDIAVREYTQKFDKVNLEKFLVDKNEIKKAAQKVEEKVYKALEESKINIEKFHKNQLQKDYINLESDGVYMGQRIIPLERIGVYVPGGTAAYPSSVLMNVIPAKVAGVKDVIMVTPPSENGEINPYIAAASIIAGVDNVYIIGGAQAVAALAYGTETIKAVDKIVGPGNTYVATAKKMVYGDVDIDMIAGPSEILVVADENAKASYIAADLMSQAEHDKMSSSILVATSKKLIKEVNIEIKKQIEKLERKEIIQYSLENYGMAIFCENIEAAIEISNIFAPEHLELMIENPIEYLYKVKNSASVFLGYNTPEAVGDYFAGVNHVLPTNRTAKFFSPLGVDSFIKKSSFTYYTKEALIKNGEKIMCIAQKEKLTAHRNSVKIRIEE